MTITTQAVRRAIPAIVAMAALTILSGCSYFMYTGPSHSDDYPISLTEGDYQEPYVELREVSTKLYDDRVVESLGKAELKKLARKYGGDAVIHITRSGAVTEEFGYAPGTLYRFGTRYVSKTRMSGIVIRFKREEIE